MSSGPREGSSASHLGDRWTEYLLGLLPPEEQDQCDLHVASCPVCGPERSGALGSLARLVDELPTIVPRPSARERLLRAARTERAFDAFIERLAALIDRSLDAARAYLDRLGDPSAWQELMPGIRLLHLQGGPTTGTADVGFVRVAAGHGFPHHTHLGHESVLVIQGGYVDDDGTVYRAGATIEAHGGAHAFAALAGEDLVYAVVTDGVLFTGMPDLRV